MDDLLNSVTPKPEAQEAVPQAEENVIDETLDNPETDNVDGEIDDTTEEAAYKGKTYKVDKEIAALLKKADSLEGDYTRKTMAVAEMRKAAEDELQQAQHEAAISQEITQEIGQLRSIESRLSQYQNVNWQAWYADNPQAAGAAQAEYTQLRDAYTNLSGRVETQKSEITANREQRSANVISQAIEMLNKPDPDNGWDGKFDVPKREALTNFGMKLGFTKEELSNTTHPLMIKTLNLARIGMETMAKQKAAAKSSVAKPEAVPVTQIGTRKGATPIQGIHDSLSSAEWLKRRNAQVVSRNK